MPWNVYCNQIDRLQQAIIRKEHVLVNMKGITLMHDNFRVHKIKRSNIVKIVKIS